MSLGRNQKSLGRSSGPTRTPYCVLTPDATIKLVNDVFEDVTGYSEDELVGRSWEVIGTDDHEGGWEFVDGHSRGEVPWRGELTIHRKTGEELTATGFASTVTNGDGDSLGIVLTLSNITTGVIASSPDVEQRTGVERVHQVSRSLSDLVRALVQVTDRETAVRLTCMRLATSKAYTAAWYGECLDGSSEIRGMEIVGMDNVFLDRIESRVTQPDSLTKRAMRSEVVLAERNLLTEETDRDEYEEAVARGYQSRAAIPVIVGSRVRGVIGVYSSDPQAFGQFERELLQDIGYILGHVFKSAQQQRLLHSETVLEVEFRVRGRESAFVSATADLGCRLELETVIKNSPEWYLTYLSVEGTDPHDLLGRLQGCSDLENVRVISTTGTNGTVELEVRNGILSAIRDCGGVIDDLTADRGDMYVRAHMLPTVDVRQIQADLRRVNSDVELTKKRQRKRTEPSLTDPADALTDSLTDRQREVLAAAFYAGYFESPRASDGRRLAESLEISSAAFYELVRRSIRNLLDYHFEEDSTSPP